MSTNEPSQNIIALQEELELTCPVISQSNSAFISKLARENGWDFQRAKRVLVEYQRFLIMAKHFNTILSPSDAVDQAWHLHMLHSREYWTDLCGEFLKKPFHHEPTSPNPEHKTNSDEDYLRTFTYYPLLFGENAPSDIWPHPYDREIESVRFQRIEKYHLEYNLNLIGALAYFMPAAAFFFHNTIIFCVTELVLVFTFYSIHTKLFSDKSAEPTSNSSGNGSCGGGGCSGCGGGCGGGGGG